MKKRNYFFLFFACLPLLVLVAGCNECKDIKCPKDIEFPDDLEQQVPYQKDDVVRFASTLGDTIVLSCFKREYIQQDLFPNEKPESFCCPGYQAANLDCRLNGLNGDDLYIYTDYLGFYLIRISANLDGFYYINEGLGLAVDSVLLDGKSFYNVLKFDDRSNNEQSVFLSTSDNKGIVGFIVNGKEWALVE